MVYGLWLMVVRKKETSWWVIVLIPDCLWVSPKLSNLIFDLSSSSFRSVSGPNSCHVIHFLLPFFTPNTSNTIMSSIFNSLLDPAGRLSSPMSFSPPSNAIRSWGTGCDLPQVSSPFWDNHWCLELLALLPLYSKVSFMLLAFCLIKTSSET